MDTAASKRLFVSGVGLEGVRVGMHLLDGRAVDWLESARDAVLRGAAYGAAPAVHHLLPRSLPPSLRRLLAALPAALVTPDFFCAISLVQPLLRRAQRRGVSLLVVWWLAAMWFNYQLASSPHLMPASWYRLFTTLVGINRVGSEAVKHRAITHEIWPCGHPQHGIHPGEPSCVNGAVQAVVRGTPSMLRLYAVVYAVRLLFGAEKFAFPKLLVHFLRSFTAMTVQMSVGRISFCLQSRLFPNSYQAHWIAPLCGLVASNFMIIDRPETHEPLITFNLSNALLTQLAAWNILTKDRLMRRLVCAVMFSLGAAIDGRNLFGKRA